MYGLRWDERVYCSLYAISETFYVLCRLEGVESAREKMGKMLSFRVLEVSRVDDMAVEAGKLKCSRAISLADCSCLATAKITGSRAVFARKERELVDEIDRKPFDVEILFLSLLPAAES